mmetsp:Transcript_1893/g.4831  ORF Transcript_1893/g.4831 Transcript_1893/m.4831 type:complete len:712 (-) Transcript_1893:40-2175(-)
MSRHQARSQGYGQYDQGPSGYASPRSSPKRGDRDRDRRLGTSSYQSVQGYEDPDNLGDNRALDRINKRHFTDVCCCGVWIVWMCLVGVATYSALRDGDPRRLYHGFDYKGQLCGVDEAVANEPYLYWPVATEFNYPVCIKECPVDDSMTEVYPKETVRHIHTDESDQTVIESSEELTHTYPTVKVAGRFCLPTAHYGAFKHLIQLQEDQEATNAVVELMDVRTDLWNAWPLFFMLLIISVLAGYAYILLLKHFASMITWGIFAVLLTTCAGVALYCLLIAGSDEVSAESFLAEFELLSYWEQWTNSSGVISRRLEDTNGSDAVDWVRWIGWTFAGLTALLAIWMACFCMSIQRALAVLEAACEAMEDISGVLLMPLLEVALKLLFVLTWTALFAWVVTNGKVTQHSTSVDGHSVHGLNKEFEYTDEAKIGIAVYIVEFFWGLERITAFFQFLFSFATATWYYTPCKLEAGADGNEVEKQSVAPTVWARAAGYCLGYHHGSIALAAFIVAIFRLVRTALEAIAKYSKTTGNAVAEAIASTCMACVWCFEEIVRFMNKNAIIELVLNSKDFFTSAGAAMKRISTALPEVAALNGITSVFQVVGFLLIGVFGTLIAVLATTRLPFFSDPASDSYLEHRAIVIGVAAFISFGVAAAFMFIFDIVSDALLFCWLVDQEDGKAEYAPKPLRKVFGVIRGDQDVNSRARAGLSGHKDF